jgi:hypothetical protein
MPDLFQVIDDEAEYVLVIEEQKRKRPNSPGTSKRQHFQRANQKRRRKDFEWYAPPQMSSQKIDPPSHEEGCSRGRHQAGGDSKRFTWTAPITEPHVEPPRPEGWKPLVLTPQLVQLSEAAERKLADERMKEWSKDQEEYTEREFQRVQKLKQDQKEPREEVAVDPGSREEHYERALKLLREITVENRNKTQEEIMKLQMDAVSDAHRTILAEQTSEIEREEREARAWQSREEEEIELAKKAGKYTERVQAIKRKAQATAIEQEINEELAAARAEHQ